MLFLYSKLIIKLAGTERLNGYMFYNLFVTVLGYHRFSFRRKCPPFFDEKEICPRGH